MKKIFDLGKDRSAISAVLVIIVVAIVVVAAVAAYVVLSNEDEKKILAPGSKFVFDYELEGGGLNGTMDMELVGQNSTDYFVQLNIIIPELNMNAAQYYMANKEDASFEGMVKVGTEVVNTIDGEKTLDVWERVDGDSKITVYTDSEMIYLMKQEIDLGTEVFVISFTLKSKELVYQKESAYKQSDDIGKKATYEDYILTTKLELVNECVADCEGGKFAVRQTAYINGSTSGEPSYYMSEAPIGVIIGSVDTGTTVSVNTIDGQKTLEKWKFDQTSSTGSMVYYYVDSETDLIYQIDEITSLITFELVLTSYT